MFILCMIIMAFVVPFFQQQYSIIVIHDILHHCTNRLVGTTTMKERQGERIIIFVFYFLF